MNSFNSRSIEAVFIDLDGTLVDSLELIFRAFEHATAVHLGHSPARSEIRRTIGLPLTSVLDRFARGAGGPLVATYREYVRVHHDRLVRPCRGMLDLLAVLRRRGYRLGIVTAKSRPQAELAFRLCALEPLVDVTVAFEDTAEHKPHPAPLLEAARRIGVAPARALYLGDAVGDIVAARAAGMDAVAVTWGAGDPEDLRAAAPDLMVANPAELLAHLLPIDYSSKRAPATPRA